MFRARFRQNLTNEAISSLAHIDKMEVLNTVWTAVFSYFHASNPIPKLWVDPKATEEDRSTIFKEMIQGYDPLMENLAQMFKDPLNKNRKAYLLLIDSTKIPVIKSSDSEFQKKCYYSPKGGKFTIQQGGHSQIT